MLSKMIFYSIWKLYLMYFLCMKTKGKKTDIFVVYRYSNYVIIVLARPAWHLIRLYVVPEPKLVWDPCLKAWFNSETDGAFHLFSVFVVHDLVSHKRSIKKKTKTEQQKSSTDAMFVMAPEFNLKLWPLVDVLLNVYTKNKALIVIYVQWCLT